MTKFMTRFAKDESGATAIEYGLIVALIAVVIITAVTSIGTKLNADFRENRQRPLRAGPIRYRGRGGDAAALLVFPPPRSMHAGNDSFIGGGDAEEALRRASEISHT